MQPDETRPKRKASRRGSKKDRRCRHRHRRLRNDKFHNFTPESWCFCKAGHRSSPLRIFRYYANARVRARPRGNVRPLPTVFPFQIFREVRTRHRDYFAVAILPAARAPHHVHPRDSRPRRFQSDFDFESASPTSVVRLPAHTANSRGQPPKKIARSPSFVRRFENLAKSSQNRVRIGRSRR